MLWKLFLFPSDRGSDITLRELTNQVLILKYFSYGLKLKIYFNTSLEETIVGGGNASLKSSSLGLVQYQTSMLQTSSQIKIAHSIGSI